MCGDAYCQNGLIQVQCTLLRRSKFDLGYIRVWGSCRHGLISIPKWITHLQTLLQTLLWTMLWTPMSDMPGRLAIVKEGSWDRAAIVLETRKADHHHHLDYDHHHHKFPAIRSSSIYEIPRPAQLRIISREVKEGTATSNVTTMSPQYHS